MDAFQIIISLIIPIGFLSLYFLQKHYLSNYLNQKGKNIADKEDIAAITKLVEEVKNNFTENIEHLKANLSILTSTQLNLIDEERNAIIGFNKCYFVWYRFNVSMPPNSTSYINSEVQKCIEKIEEFYSEMMNSEAIFDLFVTDSNLRSAKTKLIHETLQAISDTTIKFLYFIRENNIELEYVKKQLDSMAFPEKREELLEEYRTTIKKRRQEHHEHNEKTVKIFREIVEIQSAFQENCREYLYKLLQDQENTK